MDHENKFTERTQKVLTVARQEAQALGSEFIGTEHILLGIIDEGGGVGAKVLQNLKVDHKRVQEEIAKLVRPFSSHPPVTVTRSSIPYSPRAKHALDLADKAAIQLSHEVIGTEHLLLGILEETEGVAAEILAKFGLKLDQVRNMALEVLGTDAVTHKPAAPKRTEIVLAFCDRCKVVRMIRQSHPRLCTECDTEMLPLRANSVGFEGNVAFYVEG